MRRVVWCARLSINSFADQLKTDYPEQMATIAKHATARHFAYPTLFTELYELGGDMDSPLPDQEASDSAAEPAEVGFAGAVTHVDENLTVDFLEG